MHHTKNKAYRFYKIGFFILLLTLGVTVYANYDYWAFKWLIACQYIFTNDLDTMYADALGEENVKGYFRDFDRVVMASFTRQLRIVNQDRYTYLYTPQGYRQNRVVEKSDAKTTEHAALTDETAYLYLPNISKDTRKYVYKHKGELAQYPNLILDLRGNYGGMLSDFRKTADLFVEKGVILGYEQTRLPFLSEIKKSKGVRHFNFEQIIILQDEYTASSAEALILAIKEHVANVTLLGEITFGKGVGQVTIPLTGGYAVKATVLLVEGPDGESVHHAGITPDVAASAEDWVEEALGLIEHSFPAFHVGVFQNIQRTYGNDIVE